MQSEINLILTTIQNELKVPKGNLNKFGNYKYRSAEDILEAIKPLLKTHNAKLFLSDSIEFIGNKLFLKALATFYSKEEKIEVYGFAELGEHKGMSSEQCTGTASSYARKYALNGLFLIDETEQDADHDNKREVATKTTNPNLKDVNVLIVKEQKEELIKLSNDPYFPKDKKDGILKVANDVKTTFNIAQTSIVRAKSLIDVGMKKEAEIAEAQSLKTEFDAK